MKRPLTFTVVLALVPAAPLPAQCRLCAPTTEAAVKVPDQALTVEVDAALDLGRAAQSGRGGGTISLDERTGQRSVRGSLVDLGGMSLRGTIRLAGQPLAPVSVRLPSSIRLNAPDGSVADVVELRTDLSPNAMLDGNGRLTVGFGGRLIVTGGASGDFRGRVPVVAEYR